VIGTVVVESGDWVLADEDGVVVVPAAIADVVVSEAEVQAATEDKIRAAILAGISPKDAYLEHGKF
jgi:regulator of RNase E activity RraA